EHRNCEQKLRSRILKVSAGAWLPTPEHVFAWPDGQVQSSVPGRITRGELEWVWVDAIRSTDPSFVWQLGPKARAPRALRYGYEAPSLREQRPPAKEQVDEALEQLEKGGPRIFRTAWELYPLIIRSEDPRAMRWVASTLSSRWVNGRLKVRSIEPIGQTSPQIWWKVVEPYAGHHDARVRYAAVVAIEKLASPEAVERLLRQWKSKKELPEIRARILRALGACGHDDRRASRVLERVLQSKQSEDLRANAMAGVADIDERRTFQKLVKLGLSDPSAIIRAAAAYAVAVHRDREMLEHVEIVAEQEKDAETRHWMATAIRIVREKGDLSAFDEFVASLAGNDAPAQERPDRGGGRGSRRASGRGRDKGSGKGGQSS
ncbi:MAG: HEAT repeat domain-containing protein, partial [Planctomycetota bacterium]